MFVCIKYQMIFYIICFGINCGNSVVNGIVKLQCLGCGIDGGVEWFEIVMNCLCDFQCYWVEMINYVVFIQFMVL